MDADGTTKLAINQPTYQVVCVLPTEPDDKGEQQIVACILVGIPYSFSILQSIDLNCVRKRS